MFDEGARFAESEEAVPATVEEGRSEYQPCERPRGSSEPRRAEQARAERGAIDALGEAIAESAAHIDAATHRLLAQIREFDHAGGWYDQGAQSCAHWLSWRIGLSPGVAREKVRVARTLGDLPAIDHALARGEVSYCKVRAITRVATPETEAALLDIAYHATGAELEKICRLYRAASRSETEPDDDDDDDDDRRHVTAVPTDDGLVRITALVSPEESARILEAIDTAAERVSAGSRKRGQPRSRPGGLCHVAESYLRGDAPDRPPVELVVTTPRSALSTTNGAAERVSAKAHRDSRHTRQPSATEPAIKGVPGTSAAGDHPTMPTTATATRADAKADAKSTRDIPTIGETPVSAETARRLACVAGVVHVATDERGTPLDVGRKTRTISPALRRALKLRDRGCAFPGCESHRFVDAHHITHWADGGETKPDNLVLLCRFHHTLVHERGFRIEPRERGFAFLDLDGRPLPYAPKRKPACIDTLLQAHADRGLYIDFETNMPKWSGKPPDYSACIDSLLAEALHHRA